MKPLFNHPACGILRSAIAGELRSQILFAAALLATGLALLAFLYDRHFVWIVVGLILCICGGFVFMIWCKTRLPEKSKLWLYLRDRPQEVVWIYSTVTEIMPFGVALFSRTHLVFNTLDGEKIYLQISLSKRKLLIVWLRRLLPQATFGYSAEREERFFKNPGQLIRPAGDELRSS